MIIIARAPLRISLGGGGTDLPAYASHYGGFLLSAAIDKYVYISINRPLVERVVKVKYSSSEEVATPEEVKHPLVREALLHLGIEPGIEITSTADIPAGTGLGSSGSFLVALLLALHTFKREQIGTFQLAEEAAFVEMKKCGEPIGKQDHFLAAFGGITSLEIPREGNVSVAGVKMSQEDMESLSSNCLLVFTGIRRRSSDILEEENRGSEQKGAVAENLHMIKEIGLEIKKSLEAGRLDAFGDLMHKHWEYKKKISKKMSGDSIDDLYTLGLKNGATGGKLIGAGGGGFILFYCPNENGRKNRVRESMRQAGARDLPFRFDLEGAKVLVNF